MCKECFYFAFEEEIHYTIESAELFKPGETVAIGASGGKGNSSFLLTFWSEALAPNCFVIALNLSHLFIMSYYFISLSHRTQQYGKDKDRVHLLI